MDSLAKTDVTLDAILKRFDLGRFYLRILPSAFTITQHHKIKLYRKNTVIEATLDYFNISKGLEFRELELELEYGPESELIFLAEQIQNKLDLKRISKQKYNRVIESIP